MKTSINRLKRLSIFDKMTMLYENEVNEMESESKLFNELKRVNIEALKNKDSEKRSVISSILNKCMLFAIEKKAKGQEMSDADVYAIIQKIDKELDEEIAGFTLAHNQERIDSLNRQKTLIQAYLPKMLSKEEIKDLVIKLNTKNMAEIMTFFKTNYPGRVDMRTVSEIAKGLA